MVIMAVRAKQVCSKTVLITGFSSDFGMKFLISSSSCTKLQIVNSILLVRAAFIDN